MKNISKKNLIAVIGLTTSFLCLPALALSEDASVKKNPFKSLIIMDDCPEFSCSTKGISSMEAMSEMLKQGRVAREASSGNGKDAARLTSQLIRTKQSETPQLVFLNFDAGGDPTFPVNQTGFIRPFGIYNDYVYTVEERDEIQRRVEEEYAEFNFVFTQEEPKTGLFSTININDNDRGNITIDPEEGSISVLFGRADGVDYFNLDQSDNAFVDASVWVFLAQEDPSGRLLSIFSGIEITTTLEDALSFAVINETANTIAHELGHLLGLRHHDSFGAPGQGLPQNTPDPNTFQPTFTGAQNATETNFHTMASGASAGIPFNQSAVSDTFFSERSSVKLSVNEAPKMIEENSLSQFPIGQPLFLDRFTAPNTIAEGVNADKPIRTKAAIVSGIIEEIDEVDKYAFFGKAGQITNLELVSFGVRSRLDDPIVAALTLFTIDDKGNLIELVSNNQTFESFDPLIFDFTLPKNGLYIFQVSAPDTIFLDLDGEGINNDPISLEELNGVELRTGTYDAYIYIFDQSLAG